MYLSKTNVFPCESTPVSPPKKKKSSQSAKIRVFPNPPKKFVPLMVPNAPAATKPQPPSLTKWPRSVANSVKCEVGTVDSKNMVNHRIFDD